MPFLKSSTLNSLSKLYVYITIKEEESRSLGEGPRGPWEEFKEGKGIERNDLDSSELYILQKRYR